MDYRINQLADVLVNYSCALKKGEKVLISYTGESAKGLAKAIIKETYKQGGIPFVNIGDASISRELLMDCTKEQVAFMNACQLEEMQGMDAYIAIRGSENTSELSDVPAEKMNLYQSELRPTLDYRVNKTKWVVLRYPNNSMAQMAKTSLEAFEDLYFKVCTLDYSKMSIAMDPLVALMNKTKKVKIVGPETHIEFSIEGIQGIKCDGERNIPDGEVYTAPVRDSVNGYITYNTPSEYLGFTYDHIRFEVKDGKIVKATSNDTERINQVLDTDEGARYFGEFALGVNPYITKPMGDILFDEKIAGSFHFTPGTAYEDTFNGNKSSVHWDLVMIQTPEYGGGEIYFDDVLIRKDGLFVIPELEGLNPENLK